MDFTIDPEKLNDTSKFKDWASQNNVSTVFEQSSGFIQSSDPNSPF